MRRGRAGRLHDRIVGDARHAAIDDDALRAARELEGQAAGAGFRDRGVGGGSAHIGDQQRAPGLHALVAGMRRVVDRLAAHVVVGEERRQMVGGRDAHAVEMRQGAVPMAEQAHHRQHAVDGVEQRLRRVDLAAGEHLAQGQKIEQQIDQDARIAAGMAAIGEDLAVEFAGEKPGRAPQRAVEALAAQARIAERDRGHELLLRQGAGAHVPLEVAHELADDAQEALVEGVVGAFEDQRRLADERDQPPRQRPAVSRAMRRSPSRDVTNSSTRERALAWASAVPAARRWRSQPKP